MRANKLKVGAVRTFHCGKKSIYLSVAVNRGRSRFDVKYPTSFDNSALSSLADLLRGQEDAASSKDIRQHQPTRYGILE